MTGCNLRATDGMLRLIGVIGAGLLTVLLAGCAAQRPYMAQSEFVPFTPEQRVQLASKTSEQYRIQEGDILRVRFAYERELDQDNVIVLTDGSVSLVNVGSVRLAGMTMTQADSLLTSAYSRDYREPSLSVIMQESKGRQIYILGEVHDAGCYNVPMTGIDVVNALAMASGMTENAAPDGVVVVRLTPEGYRFQEINLKAFGKGQFAAASTFELRPYDIIYVPRSRLGNLAYFARSVLSGVGNLTGAVYDIFNIVNGVPGRY
jgi:protein involved in polysaccharide export with SLBB domain